MDELLEIMSGIKPGVEFLGDTDLIGHGKLDSLSIVTLVAEICDEFDIEISPVDVVPENFRTVEAIWALVERVQEED